MDDLGLPPAEIPSALSGRLNADPERVERGLAGLVLTIVDLLRELMERQALRRMEGGSLDEDWGERLGLAFMKLSDPMAELKEQFGLTVVDLELSLDLL